VSYTIIFAQLRPSMPSVSCVYLTMRLFVVTQSCWEVPSPLTVTWCRKGYISMNMLHIVTYVLRTNCNAESLFRKVPWYKCIFCIKCRGPLLDRDFNDLSCRLFGQYLKNITRPVTITLIQMLIKEPHPALSDATDNASHATSFSNCLTQEIRNCAVDRGTNPIKNKIFLNFC